MMVGKVMKSVADVIGDHDGLARRVLEYSLVMKQKVDEAKRPGFTVESWAPLAEMVAVDRFERVGNFLEVMGWRDYVAFLTQWARESDWECSFRRVTEKDGVVWLELEERSDTGGRRSVVNSVSVYEFDEAGKLRHLDIYLQMALPPEALPDAYRDEGGGA
ncbi:MAG: hypothetical protein QM690_15660 [Sphingobium sp.]